MGLSLPSRFSRARLVPLLAIIAIVSSTLVPSPQSATADTSPNAPVDPPTVSTDPLPTAQIDGVVWDQVIVGNTVFVGGSFAAARPAGSAPGVNTVPRSHLLSYNLQTGVLTSWAPTLNAQVRALDVSPDGSTLYVVGQFTTVNGSPRNRIAAFDIATGAVKPSVATGANGQIYAVTASASTVYFAWQFSSVNGTQRPGGAAAVSAATGSIQPWAPVLAGGRAFALEVAPDESRVVIAGSFTSLNGNDRPGYGMGAVDTNSGASVSWTIDPSIRNAGDNSAIYNLDSTATHVFGTGYSFGGGGVLEGAFKASWSGALTWIEDCRGDSYSIAAAADVVYVAGHPHNCGNIGGFPQTEPWTWYRGLAFSQEAREVVGRGSFAGRPQPTPLHFYPSMNTGSYTGQFQGPWSVAANSQYVVYAGEFTTAKGRGQPGMVRYAVSAIAPDKDGPRLAGSAWTLSTDQLETGALRLSWPANHDRDNENLTYRLVRDGNSASPIFTDTVASNFYDRTTITYVDFGLSPGSTHTYRVSASDPFGNVAQSATVTATVGGVGPISSYAKSVLSDSPTYYYRLSESSGNAVNLAGPVANTTLSGAANQAVPAVVGPGVTRDQPGAVVNDANRAMRFNNANSSRTYTTIPVWSDDSVSVEAWFKTSAPSGKIIGFGSSSNSNNSGTYDRHLYLNEGRVSWGVRDSANRVLQSAAGFDNNQWHHVVGTLNESGMALYVDGSLVGTRTETISGQRFWGNWRIGGDSTWAGNENFSGLIDEVAVYKVPLSAAEVLEHFEVGSGIAAAPNVAPVAAFTTTTNSLTASFDGSGSSDPDGSIFSWSWQFGDGSSGTGRETTKAYAAPGTYSVALTVTDDAGASTTVVKNVSVTAPPPSGTLAQDDFQRSMISGWGEAPIGGAWSVGSGSFYGVDGDRATAALTAGSSRRGALAGVTSSATDVNVKVSLDKVATGGGAYIGGVGRQVGSAFYQARLKFGADGSVGLQALIGSSTVLANVPSLGFTYVPAQQFNLRIQVTGSSPTTIKAKAWPVGQSEPVGWNITTTDGTTGLQVAGSVGLETYLSGSATNAPLTVRWDDFNATNVG